MYELYINHMTKKRVAYASSIYTVGVYIQILIYTPYISVARAIWQLFNSSSLAYSHTIHSLELVRQFQLILFHFPLGNQRISGIRSDVEADCCRSNISISGGAGTPAGSSSSLQRHLGLHQTDMEVRTHGRFL